MIRRRLIISRSLFRCACQQRNATKRSPAHFDRPAARLSPSPRLASLAHGKPWQTSEPQSRPRALPVFTCSARSARRTGHASGQPTPPRACARAPSCPSASLPSGCPRSSRRRERSRPRGRLGSRDRLARARARRRPLLSSPLLSSPLCLASNGPRPQALYLGPPTRKGSHVAAPPPPPPPPIVRTSGPGRRQEETGGRRGPLYPDSAAGRPVRSIRAARPPRVCFRRT